MRSSPRLSRHFPLQRNMTLDGPFRLANAKKGRKVRYDRLRPNRRRWLRALL